MKSFDIFGEQKQIAYTDAEVPVSSLMSYLDEVTANLQKGSKTDIDELFSEFIQVSKLVLQNEYFKVSFPWRIGFPQLELF